MLPSMFKCAKCNWNFVAVGTNELFGFKFNRTKLQTARSLVFVASRIILGSSCLETRTALLNLIVTYLNAFLLSCTQHVLLN